MSSAIAYLRRSKKSDGKTVSLDEQQAACLKYASEIGLTIVQTIRDDGISGGDRERFTRIFDALQGTGAKVVLCYHIDRFARDMAALLDTLAEYKKKNIQLWVLDRGRIETSKSSDFLLLGMEGMVAQYMRMVTGEKTKAALEHLKRAGRRYSGKAPYGLEFNGNQLQPNEHEASILKLIDAKRDWPTRRLKRYLESGGHSPRNGKEWSTGTLWNLQRREDGI